MAFVSFWSRLNWLSILLTTSLCSVYQREKGTKTAIACQFTKSEKNTIWQVQTENGFVNLSVCTFGINTCVDYMPQEFRGEVKNTTDGFLGYLIVNNIKTNETVFRCHGRYGYLTRTLEVYARPRNPFCSTVGLDHTRKLLQFKCSARHVYPSLTAILYIRGVHLKSFQQGIFSPHCTNDQVDSPPSDGYSAECEWRVPAANLEPLKYSYYVKMFPNLSNSTGIDVPYVVSQDYTLQLSSPIPMIDHAHCPAGAGVVDGKITVGSAASCRCVLESAGFPPGQARWFTLNGNEGLGKEDTLNGSAALTIFANMSGHSYQCRAESPLNNPLNWGPVYTPVVETPSSAPEEHSLRIEIVAGLVAGAITLTVIIAVIVWKWKCRSHSPWIDTTSVAYSSRSMDVSSVSSNAEVNHHYSKMLI